MDNVFTSHKKEEYSSLLLEMPSFYVTIFWIQCVETLVCLIYTCRCVDDITELIIEKQDTVVAHLSKPPAQQRPCLISLGCQQE